MAKNKREVLTQYGYYDTGEPRKELPANFFRDIRFGPIDETLSDEEVRISCKRPDDLQGLLLKKFKTMKLPDGTVSTRFAPSSDHGIPVYRIPMKEGGTFNEVWIPIENVRAIIKQFETHPKIQWERPEQTKRNERPASGTAIDIEIKPVPETSIILQRIGGMKGNFKQLSMRVSALEIRVAELEKENAEKDKKIAELDKKYANCRIAICCVWDMLKRWVGNNFPNDPLPDSAEFLVPSELNDAAKGLGAVSVGDPEQYFLAEDIIEYKRKLDNGEINFDEYVGADDMEVNS